MKQTATSTIAASLLLTGSALADHGREFLAVPDAHVGKAGGGSIAINGDWARQPGGEKEYGLESALFYTLRDRVALSASTAFSNARRRGGLDYSGVSPQIMLQLTPDRSPIRVSLMAGYQFAESASSAEPEAMAGSSRKTKTRYELKTETQTVTTTTPGGHDHGSGPCGPEYGPDSPPCEDVEPHTHTTTKSVTRRVKVNGKPAPAEGQSDGHSHSHAEEGGHSHGGVHQHGVSGWQARLIAEMDVAANTKAVANLVYFNPENAKPALGYAVGLRQALTANVAAGVEALGDIGDANSHQILLGAYVTPTHDLTLKLGAGWGLTKESPELQVRAGVVLRF
jgi:hypothetical protein